MGYVAPDEHGYEEVYETEAYVLSDEEYYNQTVQSQNGRCTCFTCSRAKLCVFP